MSRDTRHPNVALASLMFIFAAGAFACAGCSPGATAKSSTHTDIAFEKYVLPNGLEVILHEDHRLPVVAVNVWYHVGPAKETAGRTGFAHLFEHMMFQGSGHIGADQHFRLLEGAGASNVNGSTNYDRTNYLEDVPANRLSLALWLESDRMGFLLDRLDQSMLSNQQDVVRNERRQTTEDAPYGLAEEEVAHQLYPAGHPYYSSVIGTHADIQAAKLEDVREFFKNYYTPNNATLVIAGDINADSTKALVAKYFGTLPKGPVVAPVQVVTPPITAEKRVAMTDQVELPRVTLSWLTPPAVKPGDAEADMVARILGGGKASRLYRSLVYDRRIAQSVNAAQQSAELASVFQITAVARPGHTPEELEAAIQSALDSLATSEPTKDEMESARNIIQSSLLTSIESLGGLADRLNYYNYFAHDPGYLGKDLARYDAVTADAVKQFAAGYLGHDKRVVIEVRPGQKVLPPSPPTPKAPPVTKNTTVSAEPWRDKAPLPGPLSTAPLPSARRFDLPNGLAVYLVESHTLPIVTAQLVVRAGSSADPPALPGLSGFTLAMLDEGTATQDALTIARNLDSEGAEFASDMGRDGCSLTVRSLKRTAEPTLKLLADMAINPAFPEKEVERVRAQRLASLMQDRDDPNRAAFKIMWRDLYGPANPYGHMVIGTTAAVARITRAELEQHFHSVFRPDNAALVLAGDLTEAEARSLAASAFGGWKAGAGAPPVAAAALAPAPERVLIADKPGVPQTTLLVAGVSVARSDPDFEKLEVMNQVLGGAFSSRINMNLREAHGYTYGAFSGMPENTQPGPFTISGGIRTDATAAAVKEVLKEVDGIAAAPVTADELKFARESISRSLPAAFQSTLSTAATIGNLHLYGLPPDYYQGLPARLEAITADQVFEATKKHMSPKDLKVIAVGDRKLIEKSIAALKLGEMGFRNLEGEPVDAKYVPKMPAP